MVTAVEEMWSSSESQMEPEMRGTADVTRSEVGNAPRAFLTTRLTLTLDFRTLSDSIVTAKVRTLNNIYNTTVREYSNLYVCLTCRSHPDACWECPCTQETATTKI